MDGDRESPFQRLLLVVGAFVLVGCYTLQPVRSESVPDAGMVVALHLNDVGRVAMTPVMGPEIDDVEGRLLERDSSGYLIAVKQVHLLRGGVQYWSNESVRINGEHVRSVSERRFSRGRTIVASAAGVGGLAYIVSQGLLGFSFGGDEPVPIDTGVTLRIIWP